MTIYKVNMTHMSGCKLCEDTGNEACELAGLAGGTATVTHGTHVATATAAEYTPHQPRPEITPEGYAEVLERLIRADITREPDRYGMARSFRDLHDVVDANEYLLEADQITGIDSLRIAPSFIDKALADFHARMGWTTSATIDFEGWAAAESGMPAIDQRRSPR